MRSRAYRRNQKNKARNHARQVAKSSWYLGGPSLERAVERLADNLKGCRCICCCNPRHKLNEITRDEELAEVRFREQLRELG